MATTTAISRQNLTLSQNGGLTFPALAPSAKFSPPEIAYTAGTNAGQVDLAYAAGLTVTTTPQSLDLSGGGLKTLLGDAANFVRVSSLGFYNAGTNNVTIDGNFITSRFGASASIPLKPNGRWTFDDPTATGLTVTNSTADTITLTGAAGSTSVQVAIGGRSV